MPRKKNEAAAGEPDRALSLPPAEEPEALPAAGPAPAKRRKKPKAIGDLRTDFESASNEVITKILRAVNGILDIAISDPDAVKDLHPERFTSLLDTLIDKQQLLKHEPTSIVESAVSFEDL